GFAPRGKRLLLRSTDGNGYVLLGFYRRSGQILLSSIEPLWGFASPIFGSDIEALTEELTAELRRRSDWSMLIMAGLPPLPHPLSRTIVDGLAPLGPALFTEGITRRVTDLTAGHGAWLANRSSRFRRNLRRAESRAETVGLLIEAADDDPKLFKRIMDIEQRSWKSTDGSGITGPEMSTMYDAMIDRLRERGRLEAHVARLPIDGETIDVGYILGGIRNRRYRGLQISFDGDHANLSIGNLLQSHQLRRLVEEDSADTYDMGMDFPYKQRWADGTERSVTLLLHRTSRPLPAG
ncbi:MAG: GNAT family N-acetyltransferase, partial [Acidimicrobiia bacterium]|nr:GNAT family N-acetyltransferase [Acidimicrobiia bacterium]